MTKSINLRSVMETLSKNRDRINAIADACEKEQRERTEAENAEFTAIQRENQLLEMRVAAAANSLPREEALANANAIIRENVQAGRQTKINIITREGGAGEDHLVVVADAETGKIVPLKVVDIIKPFSEGLIADKVGLPMPTGLSGDYVWPTYEAVDAVIANEGVALTDTELSLDALTAVPQRVGVAIPVSKETINQTNGVIETIVKEVLPTALARLVNKVLFSVDAVAGATSLVGPFVAKKATAVALGATPTAKKLNAMKAEVLKNCDGGHLAWVMSKSMKAILETEPINSNGVYIPMIQNDMLLGVPVFTTEYIVDKSGENAVEYIGIGDWRYQPMGLFGEMNLTVDPYTLSRKNSVDFVLNASFGTKTLVAGAFKLGKATAN